MEIEEKNYKENLACGDMVIVGKRGQVAIFVILAIVLVAVILIVFLVPRDVGLFQTGELNPESFLRECVEPGIKENLEVLSKQGGYLNPEGFIVYQGEKVKYLCHSSKNYKTCVVQQPLLVNHVQKELEGVLGNRLSECYSNLIREYENRGFAVSSSSVNTNIVLAPGEVRVNFESPLNVEKEEIRRQFEGFEVKVNSKIYELLIITKTIIDFESTLGDSETTLYMQYYPNLKMEKMKLGGGDTIYTLTDLETEERFRFASRSLVWPPGVSFDV
jgi:hypothetical protein